MTLAGGHGQVTRRYPCRTRPGRATRMPPRAGVIEGHPTIFALKIEDQAGAQDPRHGGRAAGVGALGGAGLGPAVRGREPGDVPVLVGVEAESAACVVAAVEGPPPGGGARLRRTRSMGGASVAGLGVRLPARWSRPCSTPSPPSNSTTAAATPIRLLLADAGLDVGETGRRRPRRAPASGRRRGLRTPSWSLHRHRPSLVTEGATDPRTSTASSSALHAHRLPGAARLCVRSVMGNSGSETWKGGERDESMNRCVVPFRVRGDGRGD